MAEKLQEFVGEIQEINGQKVLVIKVPQAETVTRPDGTKDVVIKLPSLSLFPKTKQL